MKRLLFVLCVLTLANLAFAQSGSLIPESAEAPQFQFPTFAKHTLITTYVSSGAPFMVVNPGVATPIDAVHTISCPGTTGTCLLQVNSWVQIGNGIEADEISICVHVDGSQGFANCYTGGVVQIYGRWVNVATSLNFPGLSVGNHTVQTYIFEGNNPLTVGYYNINYEVFKP